MLKKASQRPIGLSAYSICSLQPTATIITNLQVMILCPSDTKYYCYHIIYPSGVCQESWLLMSRSLSRSTPPELFKMLQDRSKTTKITPRVDIEQRTDKAKGKNKISWPPQAHAVGVLLEGTFLGSLLLHRMLFCRTIS